MRFLLIVKVQDTVLGKAGDQQLRATLGPQFGKILSSGKVSDAGFLGGVRGAYFVAELDSADEFYSLLGPEIYGNCKVEAYPVISMERGAELFREWAEAGR